MLKLKRQYLQLHTAYKWCQLLIYQKLTGLGIQSKFPLSGLKVRKILRVYDVFSTSCFCSLHRFTEPAESNYQIYKTATSQRMENDVWCILNLALLSFLLFFFLDVHIYFLITCICCYICKRLCKWKKYCYFQILYMYFEKCGEILTRI